MIWLRFSAGCRRSTRPRPGQRGGVRGSAAHRARRGPRLRRLPRDTYRLVPNPRRSLSGRAGRHDQAAHRRQRQRRQAGRHRRGQARGFTPADDNEADAIAILLWAIDNKGARHEPAASSQPATEHHQEFVYETEHLFGDARLRCAPTTGLPRSSRTERRPVPAWTASSTMRAWRLSLLLQHGAEPAALAASMGRLGDGRTPASIIAALADLIAREAQA